MGAASVPPDHARSVASLLSVLRAALGSHPVVLAEGSRERILGLLLRLRPADRRQLRLGLRVLDLLSWLRYWRPLASLTAAQSEAVLRACRDSWLPPLRRLATVTVRLVLFAHFDGAETWSEVGYEGPWIGRRFVDPDPPLVLPVERIAP